MECASTVAEAFKTGVNRLAEKGVEHPRPTCEFLLSGFLGCKRLELYSRFAEAIDGRRVMEIRGGIERVAGGEPLQYVLGEVEFMGRAFKVDRRVFIPRPETELLVEEALGCEKLWKRDAPLIVDVGAGSGCIVISLAMARPEARYWALDVSEEALELAKENAANLHVGENIIFRKCRLSDIEESGSIDAVVTNPPYIPTVEYEALPAHIRDHEPRQALDGGRDGLSTVRALIDDARIALASGGMLFMEIGDRQGKAVSRLLLAAGFEDVTVKRDFAGLDRIVVGRRP